MQNALFWSHIFGHKKRNSRPHQSIIFSSLPFNCCTGNGGYLPSLLTRSLMFSPAEHRCVPVLMNLIKPELDLALGCSPAMAQLPSGDLIENPCKAPLISWALVDTKLLGGHLNSFLYYWLPCLLFQILYWDSWWRLINPMGCPLDLVSYPLVLGKFSLCACEFLNCTDVLMVDVQESQHWMW